MGLDKFEQQLRVLIGAPSPLRPFTCEGSPLECSVFLVGINPANDINMDFWKFWRSGYGYDKKTFMADYLKAKKIVAPKNTRKNIEGICALLSANKILETNVYAFPAKRPELIPPEWKNLDLVNFLLSSIRPKVILLHGTKAIAKRNGLTVPEETIVLPSPHLSFQGMGGTHAEHCKSIASRIQKNLG